MTRALTVIAIALLVTGCGLKGDLETPPPMWGDPNREPIARDAPGAAQTQSWISFTRDDVDLFQDDLEEEDPFEARDAEQTEQEGDGAETSEPTE